MTMTFAASAEAESAPIHRWWNAPFRMFQTNLREIDAGLDVEEVLDYIEGYGAGAWLVNAGGILSFYPSDLPFQTRNPHLADRASGDLLRDAVDAAHARDMRLVARMDFSKISAAIAAEHPEWCFMSPTGQIQEYNGLVSVCPSGQYYQEKAFTILDEVIERYAIDGFFFNWFGFNEVDYSKVYRGVCHCISCQRGFQEHSGLTELPDNPQSANYDAWRLYTVDTIDDLTARIRAHIGEQRPDAGLILGQTADIVFHEANNAVGRQTWHHATSEYVSVARARRPEVPVLVNAVAFLDMPYRMASEQPERFAQYLVQAISRGANPSTYIMGTPGRIPYECLEMGGSVTRFHQRWHDVYDGMRTSAKTALVRPDPLIEPEARHKESVTEFRGLYLSLQEAHVPFDVIPQEHLPEMALNRGLSRYSLVVLPDLGSLPTQTAEHLDAFVAEGGRLLSTGSSGLGIDGDVQLKCLPAEAQLATTTAIELLRGSYIGQRTDRSAEPMAYPGPIVPIYGAYHFFDWKPDADRRLAMLARAPYGPPEKAHGQVEIDHPGHVFGSYELGRTALIPWTVGRSYHDLGLSAIRDIVSTVALDLLADDEPVTAHLPEQIDLSVQRNGNRTIIHLINMSGARRNNSGPPIPVHDGLIRVAGVSATATARTLVSDSPFDVEHGDGALTIRLPEIGQFEVVVVTDSELGGENLSAVD